MGSAGTTKSALGIAGADGTGVIATVEEWTGGADNLDVDLA